MFGVALSHGSTATGYVFGASPDEAEVLELRDVIGRAQPGTVTAVAVHDGDGWLVDGVPVVDWCKQFGGMA